MRVSFERSGGFAGLLMTTSVDTATLPASEAAQLQQLIESADFFRLPSVVKAPPNQFDRFQYVITVSGDGRSHSVSCSEANVPEALKPLLNWLEEKARQR